ncbi:MAG: hypothetical protein GX131_20570 [candidate division WS1 bacterium]|nr:hypothetical protein [candidate division WS1 bacterium]
MLQWLLEWGPLGIALFIATENIGVPWPTALAYVATIELIDAGRLTWPQAVLLCIFGHMVGSMAGYYIGRAGDTALMRRVKRGQRMQRALDWIHHWYQRHGSLTVFAARNVGHVRPWASIAAGLGEIRPLQFFGWSLLGTVLHVGAALALTEASWWMWDAMPQWRTEMIVLATIGFWGVAIYALVRGRLNRRRCRKTTDDAA